MDRTDPDVLRPGNFPATLIPGLSRKRLYALVRPIFGLFCWSVVVWVVWNHALATFLNAGRIGLLQSLASGAIIYLLSIVFDDSELFDEPKIAWREEMPEKPFRIE